MKINVRQIMVILTTILTITVNGLANALPINGLGTGEISDRFNVYFVPAGYVFSIWGIIYIGIILFAIENQPGEHVGGISFHSRHRKNGTFGFGVNVQREHRRKGYAENAVRILLKYAFLERRYQKCNSACVAINEASIQLHRKLGFVEEGRRRRHMFFNGQYHDDVLFGMTREEFEAHMRA